MTNSLLAPQPTQRGDKTSERPAQLLRRSILIVEDDELLQAVLCETLRGAGHQVRVASSAGEALVSVAKEPPDVVAIDLMAHDMNGRELLSCLRNNPSTRSIPAILIETRSEADRVVPDFAPGADASLIKPFQPSELVACVAGIAKRKGPAATATQPPQSVDVSATSGMKRFVIPSTAATVFTIAAFLGGVLVGRDLLTAQTAPPVIADSFGENRSDEPSLSAPLPVPAEPLAPPPPPTLTTPTVEGYAVQVAALRAQDTAYSLAEQLLAKGFPTYVLPPLPDAPVPVYRVRVGPYTEREDAEGVGLRLEAEESFKPWVTR